MSHNGLNSCPFCQCGSGLNEGVLLYSYLDHDVDAESERILRSYVFCRKCKAHGPETTGTNQRVEAVDLWNGHKRSSEEVRGVWKS